LCIIRLDGIFIVLCLVLHLAIRVYLFVSVGLLCLVLDLSVNLGVGIDCLPILILGVEPQKNKMVFVNIKV